MLSERGTKNTMLFYEDPSYVEFAQRMKRWCDMGFWSKSILSTADSTDHTDLFKEALIFVVTNSHLDRLQGIGEECAKLHPEWEIGIVPHASVSNVYYHTRTAQDLTVIPNGSKNPERALMVLDKMLTDKAYYDLTQYGMEGINYKLDANNSVSYDGIDTTAHRFDLCLWALRNEDLAYPVTRVWGGRKVYEDKYFPMLQYDPFDGFAIDLTDIQSEYTAVNQTLQEYGDPIQFGVVPDPVAAVDTLRQRMNEAGIQRFKTEIDRQISEYIDSRN
jgi:putative aldouronate transport system substrate-binding protein